MTHADDAVGRVRRRLLQDVREHAPGNGDGVVCEPAQWPHNQFSTILKNLCRAVHCE